MAIYKTAVQKPITTALVFVAVIVIGIFAYTKLPIDQFPQMDPPYVTVMTTYAGASASEVETNVTKLMENSLNSVDHLKELTSTSKDNMSMVSLEFEWGCNIDEVVNDIRTYVDMTKDNLPDGCSNPIILRMSTSMMPVIQYSVTADESYPALDKIINDEIIPQLNRVDGIGNLSASGAPERYVYVYLDQDKLDAFGLTVENVGSIISSQNLNVSSGTVKLNKEQYQMEVRSEFAESSEINDLVVTTTQDGRSVYVRDVALVKDTIKELSMDEKANGRECARLIVTKQTGANTVQVCRDVRKEIAKIQRTLPADVKFELIRDGSESIESAVNSLEESIMYALLFVVLVVLFFLGRWRAALIVGITIPISLIVAFIYLGLADSSLNIISLCSLNVAIGMVVDDAIVVLENISKHVDRGENPREAAIYATNEVWVSVIATTLVIVAVFVPMTMLSGMAGILFKELGWIITIVCCTSTVIAISLTPMLCSKLLKARKIHVDAEGNLVEDDKDKNTWYDRTVVRLLDRIDVLYSRTLTWCLNHKVATFAILLLFFGLSMLPVITKQIGTDFMKQQDNGFMSVTIKLQRGTRIEETLKTARAVEAAIYEQLPEVRMINTSAGSNDDAGIGALFSSTMNNTIKMTVVTSKKYERERTIFQMAEIVRNDLKKRPEITEYIVSTSGGMGSMSSNSVDIEIYGYDFDKTSALAEQLQYICNHDVAGARDATISREDERPEINIVVNKEKASRLGLTSATIGSYLRNRVNGQLCGYLKEDGSEYEIYCRLMEKDRNSVEKIADLTIPTPTGKSVKLSEVCTITEYWTPPTIERKSRQRYVKVSVTPYEVSLGELAETLQAVVDNTEIPAGVTVRLAGDYEDQQENFRNMAMLGVLILLLVYIVMASQFESFKKPFIIMFTIPFAASGVVLALWISGQSLDMIGALGVVMLIGIVVKNGIVLIDYIDLLRERGWELNKAIAAAGQSRIRPILMTAMTTILGMVPMVLANGEGSEMWRPMGIVVIGGLLVSTLLTFFIVPTLYGAMSRHGDQNKIAEMRKNFIFMNIKVKKNK